MNFLEDATSQYGSQLERLGFRRQDDRLYVGTPLLYPGTSRRPTLQIELVPGFPFRRPRVSVAEPEFTSQSWHLNVGEDGRGYLCLFGHDGRNSDYPWGDPGVLLERIEEWFRNDVAGWPDDPPALDLHSYLPVTYDALVVDPDHLSADEGLYVRRRRPSLGVLYYVWETVIVPSSSAEPDHWLDEALPAFYIDIGEVRAPPRTVTELLDIGPRNALDILERQINAGPVVLICRYSREGNHGLLALHASKAAVSPEVYAFRNTYELAPSVLSLRAGPQARVLADTTIAVVGCGAVGSFLIDALVRGGAANLDMYDSDTLAPGNCVRHLCGPDLVGLTKAAAVRDHLSRRGLLDDRFITANPGLSAPEDFERVVGGHWLTIDATADETATGLLIDTANRTSANLISACVLGAGEYARVDRWPLPRDGSHSPSPTLGGDAGPPLYEGGCGDPVSPTPPYAAQLAASLTCRMVMDLITTSPQLPCTLLEPIA